MVTFVRVKRNLVVPGRSYGHWWLELDELESYGWWPDRMPVGVLRTVRGVGGVLNGLGVHPDGTPTRDPYHGLPADHEFCPLLVGDLDDDELRAGIRRAVGSVSGCWRWSTRPSLNCRTFQLLVFERVGLVDGRGNYRSRGGGCPMLGPPRRWLSRFDGTRRWPRNLPPPGTVTVRSGASPFPPASVGAAGTAPATARSRAGSRR